MIGTLIWRFREALAVILGKKKTFSDKKPISKKSLSIDNLTEYKIDNQETKVFLENISIEFLFLSLIS